jgi:hypothetical protein
VRKTQKLKKKLAPYKVLNQLRGKVWKQFSIYIRTKDHWRTFDAGHFKHGCLDFDEQNIHPQCTGCNRFWHGRLDVYATNLIQKYGPKILQQLADRKQKYKPESTIELQKLLNHYTKLNKENGYI